MRSNHSFAVNFIKRVSSSSKDKALLFARITLNGQRSEISLKEKVSVRDWDGHKEIIKGKSIEVRSLNQHIDDVRFQIKAAYRTLLESNSLITAETVKQAYLGVYAVQKGHTHVELLNYYNKIWSDKLSKGNFKNHKTTIAYVRLFITDVLQAKDIFLSQISIEFLTDFEHYIRNFPIKKHDPCIGNGTAKHIQRFKRLINWAVALKWIPASTVEKYSCPIKKTKRKKLRFNNLLHSKKNRSRMHR